MQHRVLLGITSGIAAYKTLALIDLLKKDGMAVSVIMTSHATKMLPVREVEAVSGNTVCTDLFDNNFDYTKILEQRTVEHIALADNADIMVIAPATANILAKLAHGIADDLMTTTALAMTKPILICPSMNVNMWNNPIVQENIATLKRHKFRILEPAEGSLACGYEGKGRLPEAAIIKDAISDILKKNNSLKGKKIIVTAGGTTEPIDAVRSITNRSSGKMGIALAEVCYERGAEVLLLRANTAVQPQYRIPEKIFETANDLLQLIETHVKEYDYVYHAAAVADFTVANQAQGKIVSDQPVTLTLTPHRKIVDGIKARNPKIKLIAFKAEYGLSDNELVKRAKEKLQQSQADAVVANDVSRSDRGFGSAMNEVSIVLKNGMTKTFPLAPKKMLADQIVDYITKKV